MPLLQLQGLQPGPKNPGAQVVQLGAAKFERHLHSPVPFNPSEQVWFCVFGQFWEQAFTRKMDRWEEKKIRMVE